MEQLKNQEIIEAIKNFRDGNPRERSKAWSALSFTFSFLLTGLFRKFSHLVKEPGEKRMITSFIDFQFLNTIRHATMKLEQPGFVVCYIEKAMKGKINLASVRHELGLTSDIFFELEVRWNRASKKFRKQYGRVPDVEKDHDDLVKMAKRMSLKEKELTKFLSARGKPQSLYEKIGDDEGSELIDILKTAEPTHDKDIELKNALQFVDNRIKKILTPDQLQVFKMYYHLDNIDSAEVTKEILAKGMKMKFRRFRHLLAEAKRKVKKDEMCLAEL